MAFYKIQQGFMSMLGEDVEFQNMERIKRKCIGASFLWGNPEIHGKQPLWKALRHLRREALDLW